MTPAEFEEAVATAKVFASDLGPVAVLARALLAVAPIVRAAVEQEQAAGSRAKSEVATDRTESAVRAWRKDQP